MHDLYIYIYITIEGAQICLDKCHNLKFLETKIQKHFLPPRELFSGVTLRVHHRDSLNTRHVAHKKLTTSPISYSPFHSDPLHSFSLRLSAHYFSHSLHSLPTLNPYFFYSFQNSKLSLFYFPLLFHRFSNCTPFAHFLTTTTNLFFKVFFTWRDF